MCANLSAHGALARFELESTRSTHARVAIFARGQTEETHRTSLSQRGAKVSSVCKGTTNHTKNMTLDEHLFASHTVELVKVTREPPRRAVSVQSPIGKQSIC